MSKLYVGNVPEGAKEKELRELFEAFGSVEEVAMLRGYGFVHFVKGEDASAALNALDDSEFLGSHIQVQFARTKGHGYGRGSGPARPRYGSGGGGGGGGASGRGYERDGGGGRGYRDSYRDGYRERERDRRYGGSYEDRGRDYREYRDYRGGGRYDDYYERYDYDRYRGYDHYPDHYYDDRYRERDYYGKYADYRSGAEGRGRSRSPRGNSDYYVAKERGSYYEREDANGYRSRRGW